MPKYGLPTPPKNSYVAIVTNGCRLQVLVLRTPVGFNALGTVGKFSRILL